MSIYSQLCLVEPDAIRLLILHPAPDKNQEITCDLRVARLTNTIYSALSYTWGKPFQSASEQQRFISLGGNNVSVTENLFQALSHLRHATDNIIIWIDALCINQDDNVERSQQVAIMADIYRSADHVISWLGIESDFFDGAITFEFLRLAASVEEDRQHRATKSLQGLTWYLTRAGTKPLELAADYEDWNIRERLDLAYANEKPDIAHLFLEMDNPFYDLGHLLCQCSSSKVSIHSPATPEHMLQAALLNFSHRNYFHRRWIIQEICLAKKVVLVCGESTIEWPVLENAHKSLWHLFMRDEDSHQRPHKVTWPLRSVIWDTLAAIWPHTNFLGTYFTTEFTELQTHPKGYLEILQRCSWAGCYDPRDRLYGILSLFQVRLLQPNYSLPTSVVYTQFARAVVENGGVLQLFGVLLDVFRQKGYCDRVADNSQNMPSWVPDWEYGDMYGVFGNNDEIQGIERPNFVQQNVLCCKLASCCEVIEAGRPEPSCGSIGVCYNNVNLIHQPEDFPDHRGQVLRVSRPRSSQNLSPEANITAEMNPQVYEGEIFAGDIICRLISQNSSIGSDLRDSDSRNHKRLKFLILRPTRDIEGQYRLVGSCMQQFGTGFEQVVGSLTVEIV